jgi:hypothetical protein
MGQNLRNILDYYNFRIQVFYDPEKMTHQKIARIIHELVIAAIIPFARFWVKSLGPFVLTETLTWGPPQEHVKSPVRLISELLKGEREFLARQFLYLTRQHLGFVSSLC